MEKEQQKTANEPQVKQVHDIFRLVKVKDKHVKICIGNFIITNKIFTSFKAAEEYLSKKPYDILINMMCLAYNKMKEDEEKQITKTAEKN